MADLKLNNFKERKYQQIMRCWCLIHAHYDVNENTFMT
jgi:hypothetical protein